MLIIEDNALNRAVLCSVLEDDYECLEAENGLEGLQTLEKAQDRICAILLDLQMPVMDGITFLHKANEIGYTASIPVFVVTADQSTPIMQEAYELGVMDVVPKPIIPFVITRRVGSVIELFNARRELSSEVREQQKHLLEQQEKIIDLNNGMIEALFSAVQFRSGETGAHVHRIRRLTEILLSETKLGEGLSKTEIACISLAAMMHDIGKISIPDAVLNKPGRLTPEERLIMQGHTVQGGQLLESIPQLKQQDIYKYAVDIAVHHHERWDGRGYPDGLKENQISVCAQVVSLADVYEALLSKRVYKDAYSREKTIEMIVNGECGIFGPELLEAFAACEPKMYESLKEE